MDVKRIRIWDLPTRLFHWMLVLCVLASFVSGQLGGNLIEWHGKIGLFIVGLIVFRLVWGLIGSTYARFSQFFPTPAKLKAYLRGDWRGVGHNPLGAFSVFGLLALVGIQVSTGLFSNDDITFFGPLYELVSKDVSNQLTGLHKLSSNLLLVLIGLHLCAIAFYTRVKKDNLIKPMLRGWKETDEGESAKGGGVLALLVALAIALAAVYAASGALLPPPPPPAPVAETPSW
jgi:cytochrome b